MDLGRITDKKTLTVERARELFEADPAAGCIRWRPASGKSGLVAKTPLSRCSYASVVVDGRAYKVHRLMWALCTGEWPRFVVDHINGDRHDNRLINLRDVPHAVNQRNQVYHRAGVSKGEWDARIAARAAAARAKRLLSEPRRVVIEAEIEA